MIGDFCNWNLASAIRGSWNNGWEIVMTRDIGETIKFKFIVSEWDNPSSIDWEGGGDRTYTFTADATVNCAWQ